MYFDLYFCEVLELNDDGSKKKRYLQIYNIPSHATLLLPTLLPISPNILLASKLPDGPIPPLPRFHQLSLLYRDIAVTCPLRGPPNLLFILGLLIASNANSDCLYDGLIEIVDASFYFTEA